MDSSFKQKWVRALRSGKYEQATGALRIEVGFCCLGVLCDVYDPDKWGKPTPSVDEYGDQDHFEDGKWSYADEADNYLYSTTEVLPVHITRIAGLTAQNPEVPYGIDGEMKSLASINDNGATFSEIADLIETHL
jgi:hypothetical protein